MERKEYKRYSREFKLEAVRLAALGETQAADCSRAWNPREPVAQLALAVTTPPLPCAE